MQASWRLLARLWSRHRGRLVYQHCLQGHLHCVVTLHSCGFGVAARSYSFAAYSHHETQVCNFSQEKGHLRCRGNLVALRHRLRCQKASMTPGDVLDGQTLYLIPCHLLPPLGWFCWLASVVWLVQHAISMHLSLQPPHKPQACSKQTCTPNALGPFELRLN